MGELRSPYPPLLVGGGISIKTQKYICLYLTLYVVYYMTVHLYYMLIPCKP